MIEWKKHTTPEDRYWEEYHADKGDFFCKIWLSGIGLYQAVVYRKSDNSRYRLASSKSHGEAMVVVQKFLDAQQKEVHDK